jgi:hypothetical protein
VRTSAQGGRYRSKDWLISHAHRFGLPEHGIVDERDVHDVRNESRNRLQFQAPMPLSRGPDITVADINGDGYLDILFASPQNDSLITIYPGAAGASLKAPPLIRAK